MFQLILLIGLLGIMACSSDVASNNANDMKSPDSGADQNTFCVPSSRQCKDLVSAQVCSADGGKWVEEPCEGALRCNDQDGICSPEICTPGRFEGCSDTGLMRYCNPSGTEVVEDTCPGDALCTPEGCPDAECSPGEVRCIGDDQLEVCNEAGARVPGEFCPLGTQCFNGTCEELCELNKKISSYIGCEYWSVDLDNYDDALSQPHAIVVSNINPELDAQVKIFAGESELELRTDSAGLPFKLRIPPGEAAIYSIPIGYDHSGTRVLQNKAIRVTANIPIIAYQFNPLNNVDVYSNDGTLLLPTNSVGTEYWGISWPYRQGPGLRGYLTIVNSSGQPNRVTITPSAQVLSGPNIPVMEAGVDRVIDLNPGESLNLTASGIEFSEAIESGCLVDTQGPPESVNPCPDLTGTHLQAEHPITVFGGHQCANVLQGIDRCDHIESILFPVTVWGTTYVGSKFHPRAGPAFPEPDIWRIVASEDGTQVQTTPVLDGIHGRLLNAGDWLQFESTEPFVLGASKPVGLAQYMVGSNWFGIPRVCNEGIDAANPTGIGDPAMTTAVPVDQFRTDYLVLTPDAYEEDYLNIVAPAGRSVTIDGVPIPSESWVPIATGAFEHAEIRVQDGFHVLQSDTPFGVTSYGYDCHVSYAYPGGLNLEESERP